MSGRNLDAPVAVLEEIAAATKETLQDIRADLRDLRNDLRADIRDLRGEMERRFDRLDGEMWHIFRWLLGIILGTFAALLAVMAHGFQKTVSAASRRRERGIPGSKHRLKSVPKISGVCIIVGHARAPALNHRLLAFLAPWRWPLRLRPLPCQTTTTADAAT